MPRQREQESAIFFRFNIVRHTSIEHEQLPGGKLRGAIGEPQTNMSCESLHRDTCLRAVLMHAHLLLHREQDDPEVGMFYESP